MKRESGRYPIATMCRVLDVSSSGYYAWLTRPRSARSMADEELLEEIRRIHTRSFGTYGAPRMQAELKDHGVYVSRKRIARLMRADGLQGVSRRRRFKTTKRDPQASPSLDLVERNFSAQGPDELWVGDITFIPTYAGFLFLSVVMDAFSRRIIGWSMATHLRTELVLDALEMALAQRRPENVVHHTDHGSQYTSVAFGKRCRVGGRASFHGISGGRL